MTYPGGKGGSGVYQTLINQIPPHETYISATVGHDAVLQRIRPAKRTIAIDLDPEPLKWWATKRKDIELWNCCCLEFLSFFFGLHRVDNMPAEPPDSSTFVLIDAPYPGDVRTSGKIYKHDQMEMGFHERLLEIVKQVRCNVMVCCYPQKTYDAELSDWRSVEYQSVCRSGKKRTEKLWMNYASPAVLHDYRFLGSDKRDRERIRRQQTTFRKRLERMNEIERAAYLQIADEFRVRDA